MVFALIHVRRMRIVPIRSIAIVLMTEATAIGHAVVKTGVRMALIQMRALSTASRISEVAIALVQTTPVRKVTPKSGNGARRHLELFVSLMPHRFERKVS